MKWVVQDFEEIDIERQQMVAKLIINLEQGMQKELINDQLRGKEARFLDSLISAFSSTRRVS